MESGIADQQQRGRVVRLLTLTDGSAGEMTVADFSKAWNKFVTYARRDHNDAILGYALALEVQPGRGALHCHCLYTSGGGWLDNRPEMDEDGFVVADSPLTKLAERSGFGRVCDVRMVRKGARKLAAYTAKQLGGYLTKDRLEAIEDRFGEGKYRRPLRTSQREPWSHRYPTLASAREEVVRRYREEMEADGYEWHEDPGPWVVGFPSGDGFRFPALEDAEEAARRQRAAHMARQLRQAA